MGRLVNKVVACFSAASASDIGKILLKLFRCIIYTGCKALSLPSILALNLLCIKQTVLCEANDCQVNSIIFPAVCHTRQR